MSHIPLRTEKDCLNCGTIVQGRYCHVCGQENVVPKETFWHMVTHFFYDITHFDSSFFHTVHHLVRKPGFLSKEYITGRRARYLHPIRMYVFTSAFFFLLFFSFSSFKNSISTNMDNPLSFKERMKAIEELQKKADEDSGNLELKLVLDKLKDTTKTVYLKDMLPFNEDGIHLFSAEDRNYKSKREYDSLQHLLPAGKRDGWFTKKLVNTQINLNHKYQENPDEFFNKLVESVLHRLPYMLFISLPLFALILKLVYFRRRNFLYADHGVFTIHLYIFTFVILLLVFGLDKLDNFTHWGILGFLITILFFGLLFYLYKAMRVFYGQKRLKTFIKFLLVTVISLMMMLVLFILFMVFSAVTL